MSIADEDAWQVFSNRHAGHEFLRIDPLLSVDSRLLSCLRHELGSAVISDSDTTFERDLLNAAPIGFIFQRPLGRGSREFQTNSTMAADLELLLDEPLQARGFPSTLIAEFRDTEGAVAKSISDLGEAYVGWLITNPRFHQELSHIRNLWHVHAQAMRYIPSMREIPERIIRREAQLSGTFELSELEYAPINDFQAETLKRVQRFLSGDGEEYLELLREFYVRWELSALLHWELPIPALPTFYAPILDEEPRLHTTGMTWSIPWFYLRGKRIKLSDLIAVRRETHAPEQLRDWLENLGKSKGEIGVARFSRLSQMHRIMNLIVLPRYQERAGFTLGKVDNALASYWNLAVESIRELRLKIPSRTSG